MMSATPSPVTSPAATLTPPGNAGIEREEARDLRHDAGPRRVAARIVVTSVAVLFAVLTSPPPEMVAVLVTDAGALAATFTVIVTGG